MSAVKGFALRKRIGSSYPDIAHALKGLTKDEAPGVKWRAGNSGRKEELAVNQW